ncbi:RmlC-like cupin domain-containing protein [Dichomitus squalens]|uniref:RmlC-like cupin domain-containing protein n=1 Tax=Dichomitus squalens TaxID=114155 RepID=A0A4Q9PV22_9APHY|nr:RmlC-like cupin domain-containing protein [Dichomitus squalens]
MTGSDEYLVYAIPNSELIDQLRLIRHPEGGFFAETDRQTKEIPSPFADGALRTLATTIYYLLTPDEANGVFHMNKSATMHVLHQGRAEYTLITPGTPPKIERKVGLLLNLLVTVSANYKAPQVIGPNIHSGEVLQLLVPSGVWKMSRLLSADLIAATSQEDGKERYGCLITEVVFPGFAWEDHAFLKRAEFDKLFENSDSAEVKELIKYLEK